MLNPNEPLVTVYIPTHNRLDLLKRAIASVLQQTYKNIEIFIVDDASSDGTMAYLEDLQSSNMNIHYHRHEVSKGANAARNHAILNAKGQYISGLDDDDEMLPTCIEELITTYDPKYAYTCGGYNLIRQNGAVDNFTSKRASFSLENMLYTNLTGNQIFTSKEMFLKAGLFDETLVAAQDYDMWIRLLKIIPVAKAIQKPLYNVYENHTGRITTSSKKIQGYLQCYTKHKKIMHQNHRITTLRYIRTLKKKKGRHKMLYTRIQWYLLLVRYYLKKLKI